MTEPISGDWRRALERFEALEALPAAERARELDRIRVEDPRLHALLATLDTAQRDAGDARFLASPEQAAQIARRALAAEGAGTPDLAGRTLGPYELLRELGAGGMGRVWLARRSDGLYEGEVAIKLLKAALAERGARERFAREGRILATLAHPNIARLLDAGTLDDGQLYLVLEYVEGERIDTYCESRKLDTRARVRLFQSACDAVAYAHANLVVHRDLKPSNILVTREGVVKLLDFGIAKLLDEEHGAGAETELTQLAGRALTPEYAAPEQVSGAPITTATDVYSLGIVLYHLLAGRSPYAHDDGSRPSAFDLQRAVLEAEPRRLGAHLGGDLENIVAKALKKPPGERYPSAQALRGDLQRYLDHLPVEARGDSAGYVLGKFVRRHRVAVAAACAVFAAVITGVAGVAWQAQIARDEALHAKAVSDFMVGIFRANSTDNPDPAKARETTARQLLDIGRSRMDRDLAGNPTALDEAQLLIGRLYWELGVTDEAEKIDRARIAALRQSGNGRDPRLVDALVNLAGTLMQRGDLDEAHRMSEEALAILDAMGDDRSLDRARALSGLGATLRSRDPVAGMARLREAEEVFSKYHPDDRSRAYNLRSLALLHLERGEAQEGERAIALAITVGEKALGADNRMLSYLHQIAGQANATLFRPSLAEAGYRRALDIELRALGKGSSFASQLQANLARVEQNGPRWRQAIENLQAEIASMEKTVPPGDRALAFVRGSLALGYARAGRPADAEALVAQALPVARKVLSKYLLAGLLATAVRVEWELGHDAAASALHEELKALVAGPLAGNKVVAELADEIQARAWLRANEAQKARAILATRLDALPAGGHLLDHASARLVLAEAEERAGDPSQAERRATVLLRAIESQSEREWFADLEASAALRVGSALVAQGRAKEARPYFERALALRVERQDPRSPLIVEARAALASTRS